MLKKTVRIIVLLGFIVCLAHVCLAGWETQFPPGWDERYYLATNPDVAYAVFTAHWFVTGYQHFILYGRWERRHFTPINPGGFNEANYLKRYPDVKRALDLKWFSSGFEHFVNYGRVEGRNPS